MPEIEPTGRDSLMHTSSEETFDEADEIVNPDLQEIIDTDFEKEPKYLRLAIPEGKDWLLLSEKEGEQQEHYDLIAVHDFQKKMYVDEYLGGEASSIYEMFSELTMKQEGKSHFATVEAVGNLYLAHLHQLDEDTKFQGFNEVTTTLVRLKALKRILDVNEVKIDENLQLTFDIEFKSISESLANDLNSLTIALLNSEYYDWEKLSLGDPQVDSDILEEIRKTQEKREYVQRQRGGFFYMKRWW